MSSIRTPIGILSFPVLFAPRPRAPGGDPVYQISLLFDQTAQRDPAYEDLRKAVREAIDEEWGPGKSGDKAFIQGIRLPFRKCSEKSYAGYDIPNGMYISPWSKSRPGLVDARRVEITVPEDIWAGQMARATVAPFTYNQAGNKGVSFALNNLQICRTDTKRIDGRKAATEDFPDYDGPGAMASAGVDDDEPPSDPVDEALPHAVWTGVFVVWGVELHCSVLSNGMRVIDADDVERLFRQGATGDDGDLAKLKRWEHGDETGP